MTLTVDASYKQIKKTCSRREGEVYYRVKWGYIKVRPGAFYDFITGTIAWHMGGFMTGSGCLHFGFIHLGI